MTYRTVPAPLPAAACLLAAFFLIASVSPSTSPQAGDDPNPPERPVKLVFVHHSTGENWLRDDYGGLGRALAENDYFVSDTNYGWGPDSIGDRTDIPDWIEWFASGQTPVYMDALFGESGQNSDYTRLFDDPGGENQIVMFKSCFPNSALEGNPGDPPDPDGWLTVGHAKYVYNQILRTFAAHPDKLFVVITAPPLSDPAYAANARAFNTWLVQDWLAENNYTQPNVAVFDFYNVLTAPDAHHRFQAGRIEHVITSRNTLYYPSGDDHPSEQGSRKATDEYLPLLNVYYHRWAASAPPASGGDSAQPAAPTSAPGDSASVSGLLLDFESGDTAGWLAYRDEATPSQMACDQQAEIAYRGDSALRIDFDVPAGTWGTCELEFAGSRDLSGGDGISYYIHAGQAGIPYDIMLFSGTDEEWATYLFYTETPSDSVGAWSRVEVAWDEFLRAGWEADGGTPFDSPERVFAIAYGFDGLEAGSNTGSLWVDDIALLDASTVPAISAQDEANEPQEDRDIGLSCLGTLLLPLLLAATAWAVRRK